MGKQSRYLQRQSKASSAHGSFDIQPPPAFETTFYNTPYYYHTCTIITLHTSDYDVSPSIISDAVEVWHGDGNLVQCGFGTQLVWWEVDDGMEWNMSRGVPTSMVTD